MITVKDVWQDEQWDGQGYVPGAIWGTGEVAPGEWELVLLSTQPADGLEEVQVLSARADGDEPYPLTLPIRLWAESAHLETRRRAFEARRDGVTVFASPGYRDGARLKGYIRIGNRTWECDYLGTVFGASIADKSAYPQLTRTADIAAAFAAAAAQVEAAMPDLHTYTRPGWQVGEAVEVALKKCDRFQVRRPDGVVQELRDAPAPVDKYGRYL